MPVYKVEGQKKNGLQKYRVRVAYSDNLGGHKQVERITYGMTEAQLLEAKLRKEVYAHISAPHSENMTINELFEEYKSFQKAEVRATTLAKTEQIFKNHINNEIGKIRIKKLSSVDLQRWKKTISEKTVKKTTRPLGIKIKRNAYTALRAILNYAVKMNYIFKSPLSTVDNFRDPNFSGQAEKIQYYTAEQFLTYIKTAQELSKTYIDFCCVAFFNVAFFTGMRKGEINALKWSDIEGNTIHVRRSIAQKLKGGDVETPTKNKPSLRDLQMPAPLVATLNGHIEFQKQNLKSFTENFRVCGGDKVLRDTTIESFNHKVSKAAKLPHIRIHDFRHSHVSLLANNGINIQEIARRLGHSDIKMTWNTYSHLYPKEEERALKILNEIALPQNI